VSAEDSNVRQVQSAYAAFSRGDIAGILATLADDVLWITPGSSAAAGERRGKQEVAGFFQTINEMWEFLAFEPRDFIASGDRVVALGRYDARSRQTGRTAASHWAMVFTFRDGAVVRFQEYTDTSTLEAALVAAMAA